MFAFFCHASLRKEVLGLIQLLEDQYAIAFPKVTDALFVPVDFQTSQCQGHNVDVKQIPVSHHQLLTTNQQMYELMRLGENMYEQVRLPFFVGCGASWWTDLEAVKTGPGIVV